MLIVDTESRLADFALSARLDVPPGITVLFGPSGAGKTMMLRTIAGLVTPNSGSIEMHGRTVFDSATNINVSPQERGVGYVVQDLALFPHMTVEANVMFGMHGPVEQKRQKARVLLDRFDLAGFELRMPRTLSGGQAQRVALARALGRDARILLLDEPFSALDDSLRRELRNELLRLKDELGLTIVFVTHDLREAHLLADRIAVFDGGRLLQSGNRTEIFRRPVSSRVARLTGVSNVIPGRVIRNEPGTIYVDAMGKTLRCGSWAGDQDGFNVGDDVELAIRAERVNLRRSVSETDDNVFEAHITNDFPFGSNHILQMEAVPSKQQVEIEIASRPYEVMGVNAASEWLIEFPAPDLHAMQSSGRSR